jgi:hypothetical protein
VSGHYVAASTRSRDLASLATYAISGERHRTRTATLLASLTKETHQSRRGSCRPNPSSVSTKPPVTIMCTPAAAVARGKRNDSPMTFFRLSHASLGLQSFSPSAASMLGRKALVHVKQGRCESQWIAASQSAELHDERLAAALHDEARNMTCMYPCYHAASSS